MRNESLRKNSNRGPDYGDWPPVGFVTLPKIRAALGDASTSSLYNWMELGLMPRPIRFGPNSVGYPVEDARRIVAELPARVAAQRKSARGDRSQPDHSVDGNRQVRS